MATLGDPLADLGYLTAMWAPPDDAEDPMLALSELTRRPGFPSREDLARATPRHRRTLDRLHWYQVLALWKAAIFLESSYRRFTEGASTDAYFASLGDGVPALARTALAWAGHPDA